MSIATDSSLRIKPIAGALGAEISGVDLATTSQSQIHEIREAFNAYHVLVFREQLLSPRQQKRIAQQFGSLETHPYINGLEEDPEVVAIIKECDEKINFGGGWHTDMSFLPRPPLGSLLYALEVPEYGGCLLYTSPSPRDGLLSRMPSSA